MGIFQKWAEFKANRREKRIKANIELIRRDKVNKDERMAAIEFFCEFEEVETSIPALLKRFDFSADNGIVDTREKEKALAGVIGQGEKAVPLIKEHLKNTSRIAWPLKALDKLITESEVAKTLTDCLNFGEVSFDHAAVDKNYDLLCYLADYKLTGYSAKLAHFLDDHDERVRFAAAELLVLQEDDEVPSLLQKFTFDESEENRRLRQTILTAFSEKGWKLDQPQKVIDSSPSGFRISKEGNVSLA